MASQEYTFDTILEIVPAVELNEQIWTVMLGDVDWKMPYLCLSTLTDDVGWERLGRIEMIKRSPLGLSTELQVVIVSHDEVLNLVLNTKKFSPDHAIAHYSKDVDKIMRNIQVEARKMKWATVLDYMVTFVLKHHDGASALKSGMRLIEKAYPEKLAERRQTQSREAGEKRKGPDSRLRHVSDSLGGSRQLSGSGSGGRGSGRTESRSRSPALESPVPKRPRSGTQSTQGGSRAVTERPAAPKPKKLTRVATHKEDMTAKMTARAEEQEDLDRRCKVREETFTLPISCCYPPVRDAAQERPPYQIRPIGEYFLQQLRRRFETQGVSSNTAPFVLLVDPEQCSRKEDFQVDLRDTYKYYVIGGNHSLCAKLDLAKIKPDYAPYRRVQAFVYAGLTISEARNLAWGHNIDSEFRSTMTTVQRVKYIHTRLVENSMEANFKLKKECAKEIQFKDWGVRKDADVINAQDNLFQLAFRKGQVWKDINTILTMWEAGEVKGQKIKVPAKGKGKAKAVTVPESAPLVEDMKLTDWRLMQSLKEANVVVPVLQEVILKKLSLQEMGEEFKRLKFQAVTQKAFLAALVQPTWEACKETYTEHCSDVILRNFVPLFIAWKDKSGGKKKKTDGEEEKELSSYPEKFNAHISHAQDWLRMKTSGSQVSPVDEANRDCLKFEHPLFGDILYKTYNRDCKVLHEFLPRREYTLAIADIPYGFNVPGCRHDDTVAWGESEIRQVVKSFKASTVAQSWRFVILHSDDQMPAVKLVMNEECNGGCHTCIWIKPNVKNAGGPRLTSNWEMFTVGFHNLSGSRSMDNFNFRKEEERRNYVDCNSVLNGRIKHSGDLFPVNVYQKPRGLLDYIVGHYSWVQEWVVDLFSGSGTGLASCMAYGRHCVAVELDTRQANVLQERVIALETKEDPDLAKRQPKDFFGHIVAGPALVPLSQQLVEEPESQVETGGSQEAGGASGSGGQTEAETEG